MKYLGVYILIVAFILGVTVSTIKLCGKISKNINVIVLLKHCVSKAALIGVYYSLIYPHLTCTCTLWGNICNAPLSQIVKFQILKILPLAKSLAK